jgi:hypothetical protein
MKMQSVNQSSKEGAVVRHEKSEDGWCLIHSYSEMPGWVRSLNLEK